ncbi:hypothetical protein HZA57_01170 [Candidatus Poribacteria bacterium]|nr:hypothetical protein [Candidatus Poribacteria bacterium]
MEGVPGLLGRPEPWTIEMTCLDAVPVLTSKDGHGLDGSYFDAFAAMLVEMHRRGLNHGDIRRMNLLRDTQTGRPCLVDFAQSFPARGIGALFAPVARRVDRIKFLQLKRWYLGTLPPHELAELKSRPWYMRAGHFLRKRLYRPWKHWRRRG